MKNKMVEALIKSRKENYGVPAFNFTNFTQLLSIIRTAERLRSPFIVQTSPATAELYSPEQIVTIFKAITSKTTVPAFLNLDHCRNEEFAVRCAEAGYDGIMIDFSYSSYEQNVSMTRNVVERCREIGDVSVEGEVGVIPGSEDGRSVEKLQEELCTPEMAVDFVERTGIDVLAPAIGNVHGKGSSITPDIDFERLTRIREKLDEKGFLNVPIAVHGCSGLPFKTIRRLIHSGGSKFNVSTDLKMVFIDAVKEKMCSVEGRVNPVEVEDLVRYRTEYKVSEWFEGLVNTLRV